MGFDLKDGTALIALEAADDAVQLIPASFNIGFHAAFIMQGKLADSAHGAFCYGKIEVPDKNNGCKGRQQKTGSNLKDMLPFHFPSHFGNAALLPGLHCARHLYETRNAFVQACIGHIDKP